MQYLSIARMHEHSTRLEIPKIKHAPTGLLASLEEYLNDKDFEVNRRQYLAEREAKRNGGKSTNGTGKPFSDSKAQTSKTATATTTATSSASQPSTAPSRPQVSMPLIDLFDSIQDNQQTMAQPQQYPQQTGFQQPPVQQPGFQVPQQSAAAAFPLQQHAFSPQYGQGTNPFAQMQQPPPQQQQPQQQQLQTQFTGAGFGGYTPQPYASQNPSLAPIPQNGIPDFASQPQHIPTIAEPLQAQPTSTNPFRQSTMSPIGPGPTEPKLLNNPTGVTSPLGRSPTNPFAKHSTGFQQQSQSPVGMSSPPFSSLPSIQEPQSGTSFAPQQQPMQGGPFAPQPQAPLQGSPFAPQQQQQPMHPTPTGTNPFARGPSPQQGMAPAQGGLTVHATGSTNPFRQSAFVNQQTGQGWQNSGSQGTLGGMSLDQVPTTNVFPRPGQQQQPQQQQPGPYMG